MEGGKNGEVVVVEDVEVEEWWRRRPGLGRRKLGQDREAVMRCSNSGAVLYKVVTVIGVSYRPARSGSVPE